ncbi:MAG TPA: hypothetical protein VNZ04_05375 [Trinickia sp.]|jgi:hypothetical protein|nr:hypothetical protein [Trinickia sp.]
MMKIDNLPRKARRPHHLCREGSRVMLPLVGLSVMALGVYYLVRRIDLLEISRSALFDVAMVFVALGIAGLFGVAGAWLRSGTDEESESFCFAGALIGAIVFYVALFT